ncbi:type II secretion system protein GspJ [Sphingomonas sp. Leaf17]|nr:type II secretion system protein GspJ [Sphingomonas sp. Leaf17]
MVSLMIFGMLAAAGVAILSFSVRAQGVTGQKLDDIAGLTRTVSILSADLAQARDRPARDEGGTLRPAFTGENGSAAATMLALVRDGWSNIDAAPRSTLQKVAYRFAGDRLERVAWPMVDGSTALPPAVLLSGVRQVTLRYRQQGAWADRWDGAGGRALPDAVEMRVIRTDGTQFRQMFLVGTGYAPVLPPSGAPDVP